MIEPRVLSAVVLAAVAILAAPGTGHAQEKTYTLGVFPFLPPVRLEKMYGGYAVVLSRALGRRVEFRTKSTFRGFTQEIRKRTYDIVFLQPFDYVVAADKYGYRPLARSSEPLTAVIMVKEDSEIGSLRDLRNKVLAMPPMTAAVSRLIEIVLTRVGMDIIADIEMVHLRTHPACLQAVLIGDADACGTNIVPLRIFQSARNTKFRTLAESDPIPHVLFAGHERVPRRELDVVLGVLLGLRNSVSGRELLERTVWPDGFVIAVDSEYDVVRSMSRGSERR